MNHFVHHSYSTRIKNLLIQRINDLNNSNKELFSFIESTFDTDEQLNNIMREEKRNPQPFRSCSWTVFRCHLVYLQTNIFHMIFLSAKDALIFNFHHALFDFPSIDIFSS